MREPKTLHLVAMYWLRPVMMAATEITDVTPMTIPRMVSADRPLLRPQGVAARPR